MKSALARYGYLNAKLRGRLANLRDSNVVGNVLSASNFLQALDALEGTSYAPLADVYRKTGDLQMLEKALLEDEIAMRKEICSSLDGQSSVVCGYFLTKIEMDNLKNIIRIWYDSNILGGSSGYRLNYIIRTRIENDVRWDDVINASTWDGIIKSLEGTAYHQTLSAFKQEDIEKDGLAYLEMSMDCWFYRSLLQAIAKLGPADRKAALCVEESDLDIKNILILIRYCFYYGVPPERLKPLLLPGGHLYKDKALSACFDQDGIKAYLLKSYPKLNLDQIFSSDDKTQLLSRSLELERILAQQRDKHYKEILRGNPFTIGLVLSYFFRYDHYDNSIRVVLHGKYYNWPDDRIVEVLR